MCDYNWDILIKLYSYNSEDMARKFLPISRKEIDYEEHPLRMSYHWTFCCITLNVTRKSCSFMEHWSSGFFIE